MQRGSFGSCCMCAGPIFAFCSTLGIQNILSLRLPYCITCTLNWHAFKFSFANSNDHVSGFQDTYYWSYTSGRCRRSRGCIFIWNFQICFFIDNALICYFWQWLWLFIHLCQGKFTFFLLPLDSSGRSLTLQTP